MILFCNSLVTKRKGLCTVPIKMARKIIFICLQDSYVLHKGFSHRTVVMKRDWLNFFSVLFNILEIEKNEVLLLDQSNSFTYMTHAI